MNAESPSLRSGGLPGADAFEWKALLSEPLASRVQTWAEAHLLPDPHGDPSLAGAYRTMSLCLDTSGLDAFWQHDGHRRRKFRIRRYGAMQGAFLEQKTSSGGRVSKRRTAVGAAQLERLTHVLAGGAADQADGWEAKWFLAHVHRAGLRPAAVTSYRRQAFIGEFDGAPVRLTIDLDVRGALAGGWDLPDALHDAASIPLLPRQAVLELKYLAAMPLPFKRLIEDLGLHATRVSKYRACMRNLLPPERRQGVQRGA